MRNFFQLGFQYLPLDVVCSVVEELAKKLMTSYLCLQVVKKEACMYTWLRAVVRYLLVLLHSLVETPHPLAHTKTTFFGLEWMQNIFFSSPPPTRRSRRRRRWNQHRKWLPRTKTHLIRRDRQFKEVFFLRAFLYRFYTNSNRSGVFVWLQLWAAQRPECWRLWKTFLNRKSLKSCCWNLYSWYNKSVRIFD